MLLDVRDSRTLDTNRRVVPADATARDVCRRVVRVATVQRQIDSPDEGHPAIDHDRLLVMAVHETRAPVGPSVDLRMPGQRIEHLPHVPMRRLEQGNRRSLPRKHTHVDPLRQRSEEVAHDHRLLLARQLQLR